MIAKGQTLNVIDKEQKPSKELRVVGPKVEFEGLANSPDKWFYLYLDPQAYGWTDYSLTLQVMRRSDFREFQIGFRYQDFYNRYRVRLENNKIIFDKVMKGRFYNELASADFVMCPGVQYSLRVEVKGNNFKCSIDGKLMLNEYDFSSSFRCGSVAIILWENNNSTPISAAVGPIVVRRLIEKCV